MNTAPKISIIVILILLSTICAAQTEIKTPYYLSINYRTGENKPTRSFLKDLYSKYNGLDLKLGWQTIGKKDWQVAYRYPMLGVGLSFTAFDNNIIGNPYGAYFFTNFPQINSKWFNLDFEINFGLCAGMNPFDSLSNPKNIAISSSLNFQSGFYFEQAFHLGKHFDIFAAEGLTHISNGALGFPNMGINVRTLKAGVRYRPQAIDKMNKGKKLEFDRKWQINTYLGTGMKTFDSPSPNYYEVLISPAVYYQTGFKRRLGVGVEYAYNQAIKAYRPQQIVPQNELFTLAINGSHEFIIDRFTILTQLGIYLYNQPFRWIFYERIGFSYYLTNHVRLAINLKAHYYIAEYIETGLIFDLNLN